MTYLSAWTHQPEERGTIRLLALWLLLEGSEQALSKDSRIGENPVQAEGGQPSGWPPAPAPCLENLGNGNHRIGVVRELRTLLKKEIDDSAAPQETRRVAEILELLDRDHEARTWWERAALKGDEDARDYLHILETEREEEVSACHGRERERTEEAFKTFVSAFVCQSAGIRVVADRVDSALGEAGVGLSEATQALVREIEDFLTHLDHTTGGPRC
ncbi:hypothetical protein OIE61_44455 [Streptomyces sp. NBC_01762]|uniref:hypothetical protein n=1 Tax=unclassified Streptomyces TaxID=2593676 RepID=UPI002DDC1B99|nr:MULTISPECIES: hypothetical protein [unclassified Streptomyces]WSC42546.1 hypothetical protein OIE61_00020 [Streptomyces sp. NBC_01762]WSC50307.1 hypothetical protein OIE61_44455 [Streptomyces sp. NBC_01762]WSD22069.1 hypothetical protein OHA26_00020 [Streptomyces sp. NBC_01751]WSD29907.1 hypothetical protein OHA26_44925 [Streptomyces sp. NBC_01751]